MLTDEKTPVAFARASRPVRPARAPHPARSARALRRALAQQSGVSLIWVLTVILVLLIASGAALLAVSSRFNITALEHREQQAYYTALSTLDTVSHWIASGYEPDATHYDAVEDLLRTVENEGSVDYPLQDLNPTLGECALHLEFTDEKKTSLELRATATFAGSVKTLSMTMQRGTAPNTLAEDLETNDFSTTTYDDRAAELNNLQSGGVVALWEAHTTHYNTFFNEGYTGITGESNKDVLDRFITDKYSTREARWTNADLLGTDSTHPHILGTERLPTTAVSSYETDHRRFMVPKNGRITIDPLEYDSVSGNTESSSTNTRIVGLAIHDTAEKAVLFRLASGSAATSAPNNVFVSTSSSTLSTGKKIENAITENATFKNRSTSRWASLITLDFTDNEVPEETAHYTIDGNPKTYQWHPDKWDSMDLFVQSSGEVNTNLVLGPFAHKYGSVFDYWSWGEFRDSYHGQAGDLLKEWPDSTYSKSKTGLPVFSVDFGEKAGFWILDGGGEEGKHYFRIMQGVNILGADLQGISPKERSTIYSTRKTIIGGALIRVGDNYTTDNLNGTLDGFADLGVGAHINYVEATTRFSQLIYNTDIILKAPSSGIAASEIRRPQTWQDRTYHVSYIPDKDKTFKPTMTIAGGTIYVGDRQHLTIQGSISRSGDYGDGNNMWISPDKIVVAAGGELTIESSAFTNILTDIYVEGSVENGVIKGGTLNINEGAKIKGNIYAYNGGKVNVKGNFQLLSPHDDGNNNVMTEAEEKDGILIYGDQLVGRVDGITSPGTLTLPAVYPNELKISGSSNKVHVLGTVDKTTVMGIIETKGTAGNVVKKEFREFSVNDLEKIKEKLLCNGQDATGACTHFGFLGGDWTAGTYARE